MIFWLKPKQARTANKGDSRRITEVTGEFSARPCDPPHLYMKNAPMAQKFCDQGCKTTFTTQSANRRLVQCSNLALFPLDLNGSAMVIGGAGKDHEVATCGLALAAHHLTDWPDCIHDGCA